MLLPEHVHLRIHHGVNGGAWNAAWRQIMRASPRAVPKEALIKTYVVVAWCGVLSCL
jgi:hypothetical protein